MDTTTIKIQAFGETREIEARTMPSQPGRYWTADVFAARFRTGSKMHKVGLSLWDDSSPKNANGAFIVRGQSVPTLNQHANLVDWWHDEYKPNRSQHVGSH